MIPSLESMSVEPAERARMLAESRGMARELSGDAQAHLSPWFEQVRVAEENQWAEGAARTLTDLHAILQLLTSRRPAGRPGTRWGLLGSAAELPAPGELCNVELVEPGRLSCGSQPHGKGWDFLGAKGFRTVINLRAENNHEPAEVRSRGMTPFHIPVQDFQAPTQEQVTTFLRVVEEPARWPVFFHCYAGIGRTHTMLAAWRIEHGTPVEEALREAAAFGLRDGPQDPFLRAFEAARRVNVAT